MSPLPMRDGGAGVQPRSELELELIQPQMAQKPMLRGEVGARALRVRSVSREEVWASAGVQSAWVGGCGCEADTGVFVFVESEAFFVVVLPRRGCARHRMTSVFVGNSS